MATPTAASATAPTLQRLDARIEEFRGWLETLCRIPGISADGFPAEELHRSAEAVVACMQRAGLASARTLHVEGAPPYAYCEWLGAPGAPTLLLYGHHDVQPAGASERWTSPPFEPRERSGRLYARGAADDKGGVVALLAALTCWLDATGALPLNVKVLVDGEEEVGSPHLGSLLSAHRELLAADTLVVLDTPNLAVGSPAITCRLRGMCLIEVEVRTLRQPLHSGRGAGVVPDPIQVMCELIAGLCGPDGALRVPGFDRDVSAPGAAEAARIRAVPYEEARFREDVGLLPGVAFEGDGNTTVLERLWTRPSLTVIALDAPPVHGSSNQITDAVRARLSLRTVPDMDSAAAGALVAEQLTRSARGRAQVTARVLRAVAPWRIDPEGAAFQAARRAMAAGYGAEPHLIGAGGSIGFIEAFAQAFPESPALLLGIEDPGCHAHSPNENLHLGDWRNGMRSLIHLLHELRAAHSGRPRHE